MNQETSYYIRQYFRNKDMIKWVFTSDRLPEPILTKDVHFFPKMVFGCWCGVVKLGWRISHNGKTFWISDKQSIVTLFPENYEDREVVCWAEVIMPNFRR